MRKNTVPLARAPQESDSRPSIKPSNQADVTLHFARTLASPQQYQCLTSLMSVSLFKLGQTEQSRSEPHTNRRCSVATNTARSTANANERSFSRSARTSPIPSRSQILANNSGPPIRLAEADSAPLAS